ncbi:CRISPR-associated protein [Eubacterium sp. AM05-23]|uniref:type I CRISPR-associated protein Cas7 n=1 Tax=Eubacterium TaxID=1730 RepID=UPI000E52562E|nr:MULTISPECIES: type I CRISPR-associated protein Cas7 [Eubacterium]RHO55331.1 CRISPR-associated protein [Eubacterium sp. AM05-23]
MRNRIFGVLGVKSIMANWNADFNGRPKSISTGEIFGSDKAFKYPIKKMWQEQGEKILYIKSYKQEKEKIIPKTLKERYEEIFGVKDLAKEKSDIEILKKLFQAIDVKNFGATFAEKKSNFAITGAVQIGQGFNKYEGCETEVQQILSPFRNPNNNPNKTKKDLLNENEEDEKADKEEEDKQSTLGTKIVSNEAHYFYGFTINPTAYKDFVEMGVTEGYTEADYEKFKEAALMAATAFNTNAKVGCENEFGLFVETEADLYLPDLAQFIRFEKTEDNEKGVISLGLDELLNAFVDRILSIEIYYNPLTTILEGSLDKAKAYHIFTKEAL